MDLNKTDFLFVFINLSIYSELYVLIIIQIYKNFRYDYFNMITITFYFFNNTI